MADRHGRDCLGGFIGLCAAYPYMKKHHYGRIMKLLHMGGQANRGVPVTYAGFKAAAIGPHKGVGSGELAADGMP